MTAEQELPQQTLTLNKLCVSLYKDKPNLFEKMWRMINPLIDGRSDDYEGLITFLKSLDNSAWQEIANELPENAYNLWLSLRSASYR